MPPASPVPPLPADCRIETLAEWLHDERHGAGSWRLVRESSSALTESYFAQARAVKALLESKCREAVTSYCESLGAGYYGCDVDATVVRVLGGAS